MFEVLISLFSVCLLRESNDTLNWLHDRMPAILSDSDAVSSWLNPQLHGFDALKVLRPVKTNEVSSIINSFVGFSILSLCRLGAFHLLKCKDFYDLYHYIL